MSDAIIVAIITGACALIGQLIINKQSQKDLYAKLDKESEIADAHLDAKLEKWQSVTDVKIEELTREVRLHNQFVTRVPLAEKAIQVLEEKVANLEKKQN